MKEILRPLLITLLLLFTYNIHSQSSMDKGFKLLENGKFKEAKLFFEIYLRDNPEDKTAKLCYGRAIGLSGDPDRAQEIFDELVKQNPDNIEFQINAAECLLWNKNYRDALEKYQELKKNNPENPIVLLGLANTYSNLKKYTKAILLYEKARSINPKINGIYIGQAFTYHANNQDQLAISTIDSLLKMDSINRQMLDLKAKINRKYRPKVHQTIGETADSGDNISTKSLTEIFYPLSTKTVVGAYYNHRGSSNKVTNDLAISRTVGGNVTYFITNKIQLLADLCYFQVKANNNYSDVNYKIGSKIKLNSNQSLNIFYHREYHDFNVALINSQISQNHLYAEYDILTKWNIGLFAQYYYTHQSDDNQRNLGFGSIYYLINKKTPIKFGINSVIMGFDRERPEVYFSPEKYFVLESFIDFNIFQNTKKWIIRGNAAYGSQVINSEDRQISFRTDLYFGYRFNPNLKLVGYGKYSNQAVGNAGGFEFYDIGIQMRLIL